MSRRKTLYCSFCGKSQHEVTLLVEAGRVHICDDCVDLCVTIIDERRKNKPAGLHDHDALLAMIRDTDPPGPRPLVEPAELLRLRADSTELARIRAWAKRQGDKMDAEPNPRPPTGDDWNKLHAQVMP